MEKVPHVRLLYVAGWYLANGLNHACRHWAAFLADRFEHVDTVGFRNFYSGLPAPALVKLQRGARELRTHPIDVTPINGTARRIVIHDLYAPRPVKLIAKELWRFHLLRRVVDKPYDLAIVSDPENAWLARTLLRTGMTRRLIYQDWDYHAGLASTMLGRVLMTRREERCVRCSDSVITGNRLLADLRKRQGAKHVFVLPYGVDLNRFATAREKAPHVPTLLYAGSLSPHWGIDLAIRSMPDLLARIPNLRLVIAGMGPAEAELKALSHHLHVDEHVCFLEHISYTELPKVMAEADAGILTSLPSSLFRYYATPVKLVDYMAAGLPVIATRTGYQAVMIEESEGGVLIDFTVPSFVEAATHLLTQPELHACYSQAAARYAEEFDWQRLLDRAFEFLTGFIEEHALMAAAHNGTKGRQP